MNSKIVSLLASLILVLWGLGTGANTIFIIDMCLWICMMISAYSNIERNYLEFAFGLTFFTFLMGREFLEQYSLYSVEKDFSQPINNHLAISLLIALLSFWIAFVLFNKGRRNESATMARWSSYNIAIRKYAKWLFFLSMPFAFISTIVVSVIVFFVGYQNSYLVIPMVMESFPIVYVFDKIGIMMPACFCVFSAALPAKREFYKIGKIFLFYSFLTLFEGNRGTFLINILVFGAILAYMQCMQPNEKWFEKKKYARWAMIGVPFVMIASVAINAGRFGDDWKEMNMTEAMTDFLYQQGVTGLSVKRAYELESDIPEPVSGFYTLEFLHSGIPARLLGNKVYSGNNAEHALEGNSMKIALSYTVMGTEFLEGRGSGSSYIIETYYDFGYIGIALGSICYAFLFSLLYRTSRKNIFAKSLSLMIVGNILWATRAGFSDFLMYLFAPTIIFTVAFIFLCAHRKKHVVAALNSRRSK